MHVGVAEALVVNGGLVVNHPVPAVQAVLTEREVILKRSPMYRHRYSRDTTKAVQATQNFDGIPMAKR